MLRYDGRLDMLRRGGKDAGTDSIVGVVVVTHEGAADALLLAAKQIVGPLPATVAVSVPVGEPHRRQHPNHWG